MSSQKGSLKDRLRSWFLFLNYKLKIKKQQKEQKKKIRMQKKQIQILASGKYYNKPKVFGLTILGLLFGLFESKQTKNIKSLEERVTILENKLKNNNLDDNIIEEIKNIEKDLIIAKKFKNKDNQTIYKCEQKLNNIKIKTKNNKIIGEKTTNKDIDITTKNKEEKVKQNIPTKKGVYIPTLEIKVFNKDLKKYNKDINNVNNKIKGAKDYNDLYEYEFLIKQLRIRLNELLSRYENLKNIPGFNLLDDMISIKDIDEFNLRKDGKKVKESISWCETILVNIENKKKELLTRKEEKEEKLKTEKKEELKKVEKKEKKVEEKNKNKLLELMLADKIIYDNIVKEKRKIARFNRLIANMNVKQRRHNIFYYTKNLVSSIVNFSLSLFPFSLFKNKMLGGLVSGIMLNNSLRSVRKVLKPDIEISYIYTNIEKEIVSASDYLNRMVTLCDDSLRQIEDIRNTLYLNYGTDINYNTTLMSYLDDLSSIESKIKHEQNTILGMNDDLKLVREKNKQKIKTIDGNYN